MNESENMMQSGTLLDAEHTETLAAALKKIYRVLRIFGASQLVMATLALIGFTYQFEMYDAFKNQMAKWIVMSITTIALYGYFRIAWYLFSFSKRLEKDVNMGKFRWRVGVVTEKYKQISSPTSHGRCHYTMSIFVDGIKCMAISRADYQSANVGDSFLVVCLERNRLQFAMQYEI
ncbi:MAG: hypothetical protein LUF89_09140 [Ruminococcus sp.]|nr:hypothetical protein [Ruminococcus sp.]